MTLPGWLGRIQRELAVVRAAWGAVQGGWPAAWRNARQLLEHRRVLVDTRTETADGLRVVLRTRVRLSGDTQTDVLRGWMEQASGEAVEALAKAHFQAVTAAAAGWAAAVGALRLGTRAAVAVGLLLSGASALRTALATRPRPLVEVLLANRWLVLGVALALLGALLRATLRLLLRAHLRGGLAAGWK